MLHSDLIQYFEDAAAAHVQPWSFFPFNEEDLVNKVKGTAGRILYLDNWRKFPSGTENYIRENTSITIFLIDDAPRGVNDTMQTVIDACEQDLWDLLSKLRQDTYPVTTSPSPIKNFDFDSVEIKPTGWMFDKKIGIGCTFTVYGQRSMAYNAAKWT